MSWRAFDPETLLTPADLARRFRVSLRTLERWRAERHGPAWLILGGSIRYRLQDVLGYEQARRRGD